MKRRYLAFLMVGCFLGAGIGLAANGDLIARLFSEGHEQRTWLLLDAQNGTVTGAGIYLGAFEDVIFAFDDTSATSVVAIDGGISRTATNAEPTVWHQVHSSSTAELVRLEAGDQCEWIRARKTVSDAATTVVLMVTRARR